jgi:hypothetical protein
LATFAKYALRGVAPRTHVTINPFGRDLTTLDRMLGAL